MDFTFLLPIGSFQELFYTEGQFLMVKGFPDIVFRPYFQPGYNIAVLITAAEDDYRNMFGDLYPVAYFQTVNARQVDIQKNKVDFFLLNKTEPFLSGPGCPDPESLILHQKIKDGNQMRIIFNYQNCLFQKKLLYREAE